MDKSIIAIVILLLAIILLIFAYSTNETKELSNKTELKVYSEGPIPLSKLIGEIKSEEYYEGHDNETLAWMESLGSKQVFMGKDIIVLMDFTDASKLNSEYVTDAYILEIINCNVVENRSLGNIDYPKDVLLFKNVDYISNETHYLQGS